MPDCPLVQCRRQCDLVSVSAYNFHFLVTKRVSNLHQRESKQITVGVLT
jgi:hypothetical protein